jgi:hypothetical protein
MYSRILQGLGLDLARASTQAAAQDLLEPRAPKTDHRVVTTSSIRRDVSDRIARDLDACPLFASNL